VNAIKTPYRSGLCIDRIPKLSVDSPLDPDFLRDYQSLMGCITWLFTSTRPDLGVSMKLPSTHTHCPGPGHLEAGKHILRYLKGSSERGILYRSVGLSTGTSELNGVVSYPFCDHEDPIGFCDSNWGPQDASHPTGEPDNVLNVEEARSLQGALIVRMGGTIAWKEMREKRVSRATCKAKIKSLLDEHSPCSGPPVGIGRPRHERRSQADPNLQRQPRIRQLEQRMGKPMNAPHEHPQHGRQRRM
jgi:hypothetical protein